MSNIVLTVAVRGKFTFAGSVALAKASVCFESPKIPALIEIVRHLHYLLADSEDKVPLKCPPQPKSIKNTNVATDVVQR